MYKRLATRLAGGREPNQMRSALVDAGGWEPWCTPGGGRGWEPWATTGGGIENGSSSSSAMVHDLTVADEDVDVLECGVCYHPLKPPIFQCANGHVVCSPCSETLKDAVSCHICRVAMPGGYQRCHAMERVVDSVRGLCPHARYGCNTRPAYHAREEHILHCPHAPCRCPGDACSFTGPVPALVRHIKEAHYWPCTTEFLAGDTFDVYLCDGFNFITAIRDSTQYLLLLNMASTPFGHAISVVRIRSLATMASHSSSSATRDPTCYLQLSCLLAKKHVQHEHYQKSHEVSRFQVECWCPSNGLPLPDPNASFQLFIPQYGGGSYEGTVHISATIISICSP